LPQVGHEPLDDVDLADAGFSLGVWDVDEPALEVDL
jgi:hypothetical protein